MQIVKNIQSINPSYAYFLDEVNFETIPKIQDLKDFKTSFNNRPDLINIFKNDCSSFLAVNCSINISLAKAVRKLNKIINKILNKVDTVFIYLNWGKLRSLVVDIFKAEFKKNKEVI